MELRPSDVSSAFGLTVSSIMNFLNEVVERHPRAISFAPGRPASQFANVERSGAWIERYVQHVAEQRRMPVGDVWAWLGQYGATNGVINDLVARHLERDHDIRVEPRAIAMTHGAQEAMTLLLCGLFRRGEDVLLVSDPCYIGIVGIARFLGIEIAPVRAGREGLDLDDVTRVVAEVRAAGKRPKALYDIPDFHNPLGSSLSIEARQRLLALAEREGMLILEDNPYGMFAFDGPPAPTIKSLDRSGHAIYLGTFSKTMFPAVRVGYIVADQKLGNGFFAEELSKVKSFVTVNTSQISQALAGGILLEQDCSLETLVRPRVAHYRANRDALLDALAASFGDAPGVSWSHPRGGFFLTVSLPFDLTDDDVEVCASEHGVIVVPLRWFSIAGGANEVRLSFSAISPETAAEGARRFARFVASRR